MTKLTVDARLFLAVQRFISTEKTRYYLTGVHVEPHADGAVLCATDGYRLLAVLDKHGRVDGPAVILPPIPVTTCNGVKGGVQLCWQDNTLEIGRGATHTSTSHAAINGTFPDWRRVLPRPEFGICSFVDSTIIETMASVGPQLMRAHYIASGTPSTRPPTVPFSMWQEGEIDPVLIRWVIPDDHLEAVGILMPYRAEIKAPLVPTWAER